MEVVVVLGKPGGAFDWMGWVDFSCLVLGDSLRLVFVSLAKWLGNRDILSVYLLTASGRGWTHAMTRPNLKFLHAHSQITVVG